MNLIAQGEVSRVECILPTGGSSVAATPPDTVIYAIGDIHGRVDLLEKLQRSIAIDAGNRDARRKLVVYLGDYFSRGPDSRRVLESVRSWRLHCEGEHDVVALKGNHEDLALRFLAGDLAAGCHWFDYNGLDALADYGVQIEDTPGRDAKSPEILRQGFFSALPVEHLVFLQGLRVSHREGDYYFTHGGIRPGVALDEQSEHDRMWIRKDFLQSDLDHGVTVVHGHTISTKPSVRHNRIGIDTGAYASGILTCLVLEGTGRHFLQT
ncbi:MAG: metallophosphoesterase [Proteobacteria bacterium]|nr:metallophosphoesterase [Pseudomonadota bacterium]